MIPSTAASAPDAHERQRRRTIAFLNWAHGIDHFVLLIYPTAVIGLAAIERGKHVYIQKPLAHRVSEARLLTEAARKHKVVTQMGNQGHSGDGARMICEWIADGAIGAVREVHAWTNRPVWPQGIEVDRPKETPPVPETTVKNIGDLLMTQYVLPLEVIGLLLTAAMIGAVIIAMREEPSKPSSSRRESAPSEKLERTDVRSYEAKKGGHA